MSKPLTQSDASMSDDSTVYQIRSYHRDNTVTPGWGEWETASKRSYDAVCDHIEAGYLFYQVRTLTANPAMCHKLSPPDDCPGKQQEGVSRNFEGNPFDFRK